MKKTGRNDPCPCGSGKKYKQCCMSVAETSASDDHSTAVPRALDWLMAKHGPAVHEALGSLYFGGLNDADYAQLMDGDHNPEQFTCIMINAMEWLIADGSILIGDKEVMVAELLLGRGGPLFSVEQRRWIELLATMPLRLYEVIDVVPGKSLLLQDVLLPDTPPITVFEKAGSRDAVKYDLLAARLMPVVGHLELSGAVYSIPRMAGLNLLAELQTELAGVDHDSLEARAICSTIIPAFWLDLFVYPAEIPAMVDASTGEPCLLITDHYRVRDGKAFELAMANESELDGNRKDGWHRTFVGADGLTRASLVINPGKKKDCIELFYRTQSYADQGRPWFELLAGNTVTFVARELVDPVGALSKMQQDKSPAPQMPAMDISPEVLTELFEKQIRHHYNDWADEPLPALNNLSPRVAIKTKEGLAQVKYLLHSYEHGEAQQALAQGRKPVSYDFLWQELGIAR